MPTRFNPPPNWPRPPAGWVPPDGWQPDPAWGPPPPGWTYWVEEPEPDPVPVRTPNPSTDRSGGPRVFISYRRSDCQAQANGLYDGLSHRLPAASIFMDIDSIPPGADFEQHIRREIEICDLVLVLIGDNWLDRSGDGSGRRIDATGDFVRLEIESALASPRVKVLPVLVEGATMPSAVDLPESVRPLARINAMELDDRRWTADLRRLAATVEALTRPASPPPSPPPADPPTPVNPPTPANPPAPPPPGRTGAAVVGWLMVALPVLSFGLATFVPALWAGIRRRHDRRFRTKMFVFAVVIGVLTIVGVGLAGSADRESAASNVGVALWLACVVVAVVVAAVTRKAATDLPVVGAELRRRRERDQYRSLVRNDPGLARSMAVGRPDVSRSFSDGGLLDLNSLPVAALVEFGPMSTDDAQRVVARRQQLGRLTSLSDLATAGVTTGTLDRLRESAVFL